MTTLWNTIGFALLAGFVGLSWGMSEIVDAFKNETGRALRTGGAFLLILLNFVAALLIFLLVIALVPTANTWITAILVGLAWPTVIRNMTFKLAQPLPSAQANELAVIRLEQAYGNVQKLARHFINNALTRQRMRLVAKAIDYEISDLERYTRLAVIAAALPPEETETYINNVLRRQVSEEIKKALLAVFILRNFDRDTLEEFLKNHKSTKA